MIKKLFLFLFLVSIANANQGIQSHPTLKALSELLDKGYKATFILPVSVPKINILAVVPGSYKMISNLSDMGMMEFIKKEESPENWSHIITLTPIVGGRVSASSFMDAFLESMRNANGVSNFIVLSQEGQKFDSPYHETQTAVIKYQLKGRVELLKVFCASGPVDCSVVQVTYRVSENKDKGSVKKEMEDLFSKVVALTV